MSRSLAKLSLVGVRPVLPGVLGALLGALACSGSHGEARGETTRPTNTALAANVRTGCIDRFDAVTDYFPEKLAVETAAGFSLAYHEFYKVVTVRASSDKLEERYVLLQCGAPAPALDGDLASAVVIRIPITSLFSTSTTHLPLLVDLDRLDVLAGTSRLSDVTSPPVIARIGAGKVTEFAPASVDAELVVAKRPDLVMAGGTFSPTFATIRGAGIPIVSNLEYLEETPLGRAEWVKFVGLFLNEERRAGALFDSIKHDYRRLAQVTSGLADADRPRIMTGRASHGTFTIAGGRSYVAALIRDAGGRYVWDDNPATASDTVDLEAQVRRAAAADIWINGGGWKNRASMLANEPRYEEFKAFREGRVWVYERRMNAAGINDYWSRSVTRPDLLLADLIRIFHPDLLPDHILEWYMQVPQ